MKVRLITFGGNVDRYLSDFGFGAALLYEYTDGQDKVFFDTEQTVGSAVVGELPSQRATVKVGQITASASIVKIGRDFSITEVVPRTESGFLELRAVLENGDIVYSLSDGETGARVISVNKGLVLRANTPVIGFDRLGSLYKISEENFERETKKVSYFDLSFTLLEQTEGGINEELVAKKQAKEYENAYFNELSATSGVFFELTQKYKDRLYFLPPTADQMKKFYLKQKVAVVCSNLKCRQYRLVKFDSHTVIAWELELGGFSVNGDLIKLGSFYYCLTALNKASSKWSVVKIADGTVADDYVFFGANARASALNGKYSIVYDDIKAFTPIQKELYKTQKISIGASCLIIID